VFFAQASGLMKPWLQELNDPLSVGRSLRCSFRGFAFGLLFVLYGLAFQVLGQLLMLATLICIWQDLGNPIGRQIFVVARLGNAIGIVLSFFGRRKCLTYAPSVRGQWLLWVAIALDIVAFLALISPGLAPLPNFRRFFFLPEAASIAFFLLFLCKLTSVIAETRFRRPIVACFIAGGISLLAYIVIQILIPPARVGGAVLPLINGNYFAILWSLSATIFAVIYARLLWRLRRVLHELDEALLNEAVTTYLTEQA
jgi:hypothetical protein